MVMTAASGQSEPQRLTPVHTGDKIALLDHSRLRKNYKAFQLMRDSAQLEWQALEKKEELIKADSTDDAKKQALLNACQSERRQFLQKRDALIQQYESKIRDAIAKVVAEGGFTDVQPIHKDKPVTNGTDITDKVLNKLN
jgi:Skp family chaperone for outer membrane proteins